MSSPGRIFPSGLWGEAPEGVNSYRRCGGVGKSATQKHIHAYTLYVHYSVPEP